MNHGTPDDSSSGPLPDQPRTISIEPYRAIGNNKSLMDILLSDRNTGNNLIWATDDYASEGTGFGSRDQIQYLFIINPNRVIRPRYLKSQSEQRSRSKDMAEVFTPPWIVNKQNNLVDDQWIGRTGAFNTETSDGWVPSERVNLGEHTWKEYVGSTRLEVCCGEAPYLTTRYDSINGYEIPVGMRVGILDRKLRVISENVDTESSWLYWANAAMKHVYGYDFQGDNVLLARENLLLTFSEFHREKFEKEPEEDALEEVARILSWNIWQMDGLKLVVPFSCERSNGIDGVFSRSVQCKACETGKGIHAGRKCRIMDWEKESPVDFTSLMGKGKTSKPMMTVTRTLESFGA